jgi:hypothetical protein
VGLGWPRAKYVRSHCMALASPLITSPTRAPRLARTTTSTFSTVSLQRGGGAAVNRPRAPTPLLCQQALGCAPVLIFYFFMYWSAPPVLPGPDHGFCLRLVVRASITPLPPPPPLSAHARVRSAVYFLFFSLLGRTLGRAEARSRVLPPPGDARVYHSPAPTPLPCRQTREWAPLLVICFLFCFSARAHPQSRGGPIMAASPSVPLP